jgi:hypothetical protein
MPEYKVLKIVNKFELIENVNHVLNEVLVPDNWRLVDITWQYEFALLTLVRTEDEG